MHNMLQDAEQDLADEEDRQAERAARETAARGPAQQLATTLINLRSWQIGKPQLSVGRTLYNSVRLICSLGPASECAEVYAQRVESMLAASGSCTASVYMTAQHEECSYAVFPNCSTLHWQLRCRTVHTQPLLTQPLQVTHSQCLSCVLNN